MRSYAYRAPSSIWFSVAKENYKLDGLQGPGKLMALSAYGESKEDIEIDMFNHLPILRSSTDLWKALTLTKTLVIQNQKISRCCPCLAKNNYKIS